MHRRTIVVLSVAAIVLVGCADGDSPTARDEGTVAESVVDAGAGVSSSATVASEPITSADVSAATGAHPTSAATTAVTATTAVDGGDQPPPPVSGCIDAPVGVSVVEISFDDDTLRYGAAVAPPCVRVHAGQQLRVTNAAHFDSDVSVGASSSRLAIGRSVTTAALGTFHGVGDVVDVRVDVLSASVLIQVLR